MKKQVVNIAAILKAVNATRSKREHIRQSMNGTAEMALQEVVTLKLDDADNLLAKLEKSGKYTFDSSQALNDLAETSQELFLLSDVQKLTRQNEALTKQKTELTSQVKNLTAQNKSLTSQAAGQTSQEMELTSQLEKLTRQEEELTRQNNLLSSQAQELISQNDELTRQGEILTRQLETLTKQDGEQTSHLETLTIQNNDLAKQLQEVTSQLQEIETERQAAPNLFKLMSSHPIAVGSFVCACLLEAGHLSLLYWKASPEGFVYTLFAALLGLSVGLGVFVSVMYGQRIKGAVFALAAMATTLFTLVEMDMQSIFISLLVGSVFLSYALLVHSLIKKG